MAGAAGTPKTNSSFLMRLGYYALGIAIGFVLLGLFWSGRAATIARERAEQERARAAAAEQAARAEADAARDAKGEGAAQGNTGAP